MTIDLVADIISKNEDVLRMAERPFLFIKAPYDEIGRDCFETEPKGMQKLSGKRTGFGRNSGEP